MSSLSNKFVVATPFRTVLDSHARVLAANEMLRLCCLGTRRGIEGVPPSKTRLNPLIGLAAYAATHVMNPFVAESFRFGLNPFFDRWVRTFLRPGDHILSSFGYANRSFEWVRRHGGKTFLDGGNSHPEQFWEIVSEEHKLWKCPVPAAPRHWIDRSIRMLPYVDFVLAPSTYVRRSFLTRGFTQDQILDLPYPVNLNDFFPVSTPRPNNRPLTLVNTGSLSLRKGLPYLLEAFRIVRKVVPNARLLLSDSVMDSAKPVLETNSDIPIEWTPVLPHTQLGDHLRSADIFVMLSLEEGMVRTGLEAMACGLPVVVTPHTGINDYVQPGINGEVVPIRDPVAAADAILRLWENIQKTESTATPMKNLLSPMKVLNVGPERFAETFLAHLKKLSESGQI